MKNLVYLFLFCFLFNLKLFSIEHDSCQLNFINGYYKDMEAVIPIEIINKLKNTDIENLIENQFFSLDISFTESCKMNDLVRKYLGKTLIKDTCIKYFDSFLCEEFDGSTLMWRGSLNNIIEKGFYYYIQGQVYNYQNDLDSIKKLKIEYDSTHSYVSTADTVNGRFIPKDINECLEDLDSIFSDDFKIQFMKLAEDELLLKHHFSLGMELRKRYALWGKSRLQRSIENQFGFGNPDRQSNFIILLFHRKIKGLDLELEKTVDFFKNEEDNEKIINNNKNN
ncbi:MAG: hypothetical protein KIT33_00455 [Candidatus Kapabacteria bacterium]|nr:hypothetical protein [Ignavibacteriota bacterium]MCW5883419.1 hypothetical protein [Candidatus Kapabacteria bacterium]